MAGVVNMNSNLITSLQTSNILTDAISKYQVDNEPYKAPFSVTSDPSPAIVNETYLVDVSGGPVTFTLPASPAEGSKVTVVDKVGLASVNDITVTAGSGNSIQGDTVIDIDNAAITLVYSTNIWYQVRNTKVSVVQSKNLYVGNYMGLSETTTFTLPQNITTTIPFSASAYTSSGNLTKNGDAVTVLAGRLYKVYFGVDIYSTSTHEANIVGSVSGTLIPAISAPSFTLRRSGIQRTHVYVEPTMNEDLSVVATVSTSATTYSTGILMSSSSLEVLTLM